MTAIRNLQDEAPLTARSIVASTLLGVRPPALPPAALVRAGEIFGIAEGTTRVALSRMLAAGELEMDDGRYTLHGRLLERMARQDASQRPAVRKWDGTWRTAVVTANARSAAERSELRAAMHELRFAELREGVWMRPDNLGTEDAPRARAIADDQCTWLRSSVDDPSAVANELWDLDAWAERATMLRRRLDESRRALEVPSRDDIRDGFVIAAAALRHMQADPLMPPDLLPADWPGDALRTEYADYGRIYGQRFRSALA